MKIRVNFPELGLAGFFLILSCWYLSDTYRASSSVENLLLILPAAIVVILLSLWIIVRSLLTHSEQDTDAEAEDKTKPKKKQVSVLGAMCILAGFVLSMDWIGFDAATFLFMAALMFLQGERRPFWLGGFSFVFALLVSLFFEYMIPYPMPMLLGKEFFERLL